MTEVLTFAIGVATTSSGRSSARTTPPWPPIIAVGIAEALVGERHSGDWHELRIVHRQWWQLRLVLRLLVRWWRLWMWLGWWWLLLDNGLLDWLYHSLRRKWDGVARKRLVWGRGSVVRGRRHDSRRVGWGASGQHKAGRLHNGGRRRRHCGHRRERCHNGRVHVRRIKVDLRLLEKVKPTGNQRSSLYNHCRLHHDGVTGQQRGWGCRRCGNWCHRDSRGLNLPQGAWCGCYRLWKLRLLLRRLYQGFGHLCKCGNTKLNWGHACDK